MYGGPEKSVPLEFSTVVFLHVCAVALVSDAYALPWGCEGGGRGAVEEQMDGESWSRETLLHVG